MKKIVNDVVTVLKKYPSPEKKGQTFWDYLKSQLYSESTWDQKDIKVIEKEIDNCLSKLDKKDLTEMWKNTDKGTEKFEAEKKVEAKEMKADLSDELLGQVMDRMDDNYSSKDTYYSQPDPVLYSNVPKGENDLDDDSEPENINEEEVELDDDLLGDDEFDEDEDVPL
ncbi:MAG: hypothetical protein NTZ27_10940 [Ignavibacteriales bacterium]|nr:hypothetical protein [Ignavibacteriales bacterium]